MKTIMLDWIPTSALQEFIEYHWYYLPESIEKDTRAWIITMQELILLLEELHLKVKLTVTPSED